MIAHPVVVVPPIKASSHSPVAPIAQGCAKSRLKRVLGRLLFPTASARWQRYVQGDEMLRELAGRHAVLTHKIYRPYLSRGLRCGQRVDALIEHYRVVARKGLTELVRQAALADIELASMPCKSGKLAQIALSAIHEGHREGELALKLRYGGEQIYSASLLFVKPAGQLQLMIGRLQGTSSEMGRNLVREATRDLYACRPGGLLIALARHIAFCLGIPDVLLVSNENRVALNWWRRLHITSDYDRLWMELGAQPRADGNYQLTGLAAPDIDVEALPSKKRGEARRKLALQEALFVEVGKRFGAREGPKGAGLVASSS